jgi:leader peptidase (prepilin peptidase)/N-methyltransferase
VSALPLPAVVGLAFVVGLCVGSFLNVVIHRLPALLFARAAGETTAEGLCFSRSRCNTCRTAIAARDNIPLLSYVLLRGRCRQCHEGISLRYPLIEATVALLFAYLEATRGVNYTTAGLCVLFACLIALAAIDLDHMLLPDVITLPLLAAGLAFNAGPGLVTLPAAAIGAVVGLLFLWAVAAVAERLAGREALGFGDAKLLSALGAWLGFACIVPTVLIAIVVTATAMLGARFCPRLRHTSSMPFGPGLALGAVLVALYNH